MDAFGGQRRQDHLAKQVVLTLDQIMRFARNPLERLLRRNAFGQQTRGVVVHVFFEPCHAHLKELIEVGRHNTKKFKTFEQRVALVFSLRQHAAVELQ